MNRQSLPDHVARSSPTRTVCGGNVHGLTGDRATAAVPAPAARGRWLTARSRITTGLRRAVLVLVLVVALVPAGAAGAGGAIVLDDLNLRDGPGLEYDIIAVLPAGAAVEITGAASDGWYPVVYDDLAGWVSGVYLAVDGDGGDGGDEDNDTGAGDAVVLDDLNLRLGPGLDEEIITVLPAGVLVEITGAPIEGWYPVSYGGLTGWVSGAYLALDGGDGDGGGIVPGPATVAAEVLNFRSGPGLDAEIMAELVAGTTVEIVGESTVADGYTWVEVWVAETGSGWVAAEYLVAGTADAAPAPSAVAGGAAEKHDTFVGMWLAQSRG